MGTLYRRTAKGPWQAEFTAYDGQRVQRSTKVRDKKTAQSILNHWEHEAGQRASGMIDPRLERLAAQSIRNVDEHIDEWINSLKAKGRNQKHVERVKAHVKNILASFECERLDRIHPENIEAYATGMAKDGKYPRTIQSHLRSIKQFTRWAAKHHRIVADPLLSITPPNPNSKRSIERRAFTVEEWRWLRDTTAMQPVRFGMTGPERSLLFEVCLQTGLRANELRELTVAKLSLTSQPPFVLAQSKTTKNKKIARQYITPSLAKRLGDHCVNKDRVFPDLTPDTADMLRADLAAPRAAYLVKHPKKTGTDFLTETNSAGERYDFHALRHTCGAWLSLAGVHPKAIQTIMRHATITLTMDTYGHLFPSMESEAIAKLGAIMDGT